MMFAEPPRTAYDLHFELAGIPVRVHPLFWLVGLIIGALSSEFAPNRGIAMVLFVIVMFFSILIHEMGHAFAMRAFGQRPRVLLYVMGGLAMADSFGMGMSSSSSNRSRDHILISAAGPAAGFLVAGITVLAFHLVGGSIKFTLGPPFWQITLPANANETFGILVHYLLFVNIFWGLINLVPVYPLDGGQIARELFVMRDPWQGVIRSLWLSVFAGGAMAVFGMISGQYFLMFLFGSLAISSYMGIQQLGGGGYGGGRIRG